jgi:hypothetical protein
MRWQKIYGAYGDFVGLWFSVEKVVSHPHFVGKQLSISDNIWPWTCIVGRKKWRYGWIQRCLSVMGEEYGSWGKECRADRA